VIAEERGSWVFSVVRGGAARGEIGRYLPVGRARGAAPPWRRWEWTGGCGWGCRCSRVGGI